MNEEPAKQAKPWAGWTVALLAAPVLYVLLLPPFFYGMAKNWSTGRHENVAPWVSQIAQPFQWLCGRAAFEGPLEAYSGWWWNVYFGKAPLTYK